MALQSFRPFRIDTIVSAFRRLRFQPISSSLVRPKNLPQFAMEGVWYDLPDEQIAKHPVPRGQSRLLLVHPPDELYEGDKPIQLLQDRKFQDVVDLLPAGAHLVVNESRVFEARMWAISPKEGEIPIEVMLLAPEQQMDQADGGKHSFSFDPSLALQSRAHGQIWRAMVRTVVKEGDKLEILINSSSNKPKKAFVRVAQVFSQWEEENEPLGTEVAIELLCNRDELSANVTMSQFVARVGDIPIPPYLNRESTALDRTDYQTVFSSSSEDGKNEAPTDGRNGSVAAPTAGLHFSEEIMTTLLERGVRVTKVRLHVSQGTFRPVTTECVSNHDMHGEHFSVDAESLEELAQSLENDCPIVAVGTTSVRVLESLYWLGASGPSSQQPLALGQWDAYNIDERPKAQTALRNLAAIGGTNRIRGVTEMCIVPGYHLRVLGRGGVITNFHQADSTLMCLVATFFGGVANTQTVYQHALSHGYRFLSYGDACFIQLHPDLRENSAANIVDDIDV